MNPSVTRVWFNKTFSSIHAALTLIRQADTGQRYQLLGSNSNPHALGPLGADVRAIEPADLRGGAYLEWCLDFCRTQGVGIFVPGKEAALISAHKAEFAALNTRVLSAASAESLDRIHDKARFYACAQSPSAPPPVSETFEHIDQFDAAYAHLRTRYPVLCMKPAVSVYGIGFRRIVEDRSGFDLLMAGDAYRIDLPTLRDQLARAERFKTMLLMPYLSGHEFSVDCVADQGELICAVARRKPLHAGHGQEIVVREDIDLACRDLIRQFILNGNINIQFREGDEGLRLLEINPRMSGGIAMASLAGPNLPYIALAVFDRGRDAVDIPAIAAGMRVAELNQAICLP